MMTSNLDKRRQRSLRFFSDKKSGKYKPKNGEEKLIPHKDDTQISTSWYCVNVVLPDISLIVTDHSMRPFPSAYGFLKELKRYFTNVNVILYTDNKADVAVTKNLFDEINLIVDAKDAIIVAGERPILQLRKYLCQRLGSRSLAGPFVLLCKTMNANNNKQYDIVKDVRRFYVFDENILTDVNYQELIKNIQCDITDFITPKL